MRKDVKTFQGKTYADFLREEEKGLLWLYEREIWRLQQLAAKIRARATGRRKYAARIGHIPMKEATCAPSHSRSS